MGNKASSPCRKKDAGDACEVKEDDRVENATYTCQALDDDKDKLTCALDSCNAGYMLSNNKCVVPALNTKDYETRLNELGGVIYLDRHGPGCVNSNGALNQFKLHKTGNQMQYKYRCVEGIPGYSLGTPLNAEFVTTAKNMDYRSLRGINVDCGNKPVGRFRLTRGYTNGSTTDKRDISYNYTCLNNGVNSSTCQTKATKA